MTKRVQKAILFVSPNSLRLKAGEGDSLAWWMEQYFRHEITTQASSEGSAAIAFEAAVECLDAVSD